MSTDFQKLAVKRYPKVIGRKSEEYRYWRKFKSPILAKEYASVTSVHFSPVAPHDFAVTASARVQIYSAKTHTAKKTISRFKDTAYGATFRNDGKLIVAGDATGLVQVFDVGSRAILRTFREHTHPVHVTKFLPNNTQIMTAGDDKIVKVWDIPSETAITTFRDHTDYIRSGSISPDDPNLILSGSYDRSIKLFDLRANSCVMTMDHHDPVEDLLMFPGGGVVVSAGGTNIKVWDLFAGGRPMQVLSNHQKTVTSLCFDGNYTRLLAGSLDQHVKIYNVQDYKVVHSVKYPAPILSVALSPDDTHLVTGMANGLLSIRQRQLKAAETPSKKDTDDYLRTGSYRFFIRGQTYTGNSDDFTVESKRKRRLADYDRLLKKFEYGNALDAALRSSHPPVIIVSLLQELIHRDGLSQALSGRDDISLEPIVYFIVKHVDNPKYSNLLIDVTECILELYASVLGQSPLVDDLITRLQTKVNKEVLFQKDLQQVLGSIEMLFAKSTGHAAPPGYTPEIPNGIVA
ncbi:hypothetical protein BZG36_04583 [Bifiguratus adelaidae]|uniref:U3 small nucleolar RNA-associated protein 15 C-terminal domain-containing protein n=1 Tax=Bifiguratus adelaidae TaxID=1938954 RepID=A0A261XUW5_9FUNG|nr:hypothetical protein BZG36_04583 [Bifiguratus adelaidae]